ncbi:MAG: hypothetical protein ACREX0_17330 [Noviherbaspirillum sp.]
MYEMYFLHWCARLFDPLTGIKGCLSVRRRAQARRHCLLRTLDGVNIRMMRRFMPELENRDRLHQLLRLCLQAFRRCGASSVLPSIRSWNQVGRTSW